MTIWILALLLFAMMGFMGYNLGAIRMGFSIIGLTTSAFLCGPAAKVVTAPVKGLLGAFSIQNPVVIWAVAPVVGFAAVLTLFIVAAEAAHRQVEVYYKYKAGDLRLSLWERMNKRVGACLGTINALIYLILISLVIYVISYSTTQMAINESGPKLVRYVNRAGHDVASTGLAKVVRAIDPVPQNYYEASDIIGLVYHNPLTEGRLSRYPTFLGLAERQEFQDLANDSGFLEMMERQAPVAEILDNEKTKHILNNPGLLKDIWGLLGGDLHDLHVYLQTGESPKYSSQKILGRWTFDPKASVVLLKQKRPNISSLELQRLKKYVIAAYGKTILVATPDQQVLLKNIVMIKPGTIIKGDMLNDLQKLPGQWQESGNGYSVSINGLKDLTGTIKNDRLELTGEWSPLVFDQD